MSNHHGDNVPNITSGFDRTFGPSYFYVNHGKPGSSLADSRADANQYANPYFASEFYDSIAQYVPNYVSSNVRGSWDGKVQLPPCATKPIAVLAQNGVDFQDNILDTTAYQYWAEIDTSTGCVSIDRIKPGKYRLTIYGDNVFGQYIQDDIVISSGQQTTTHVNWEPQGAGKELWRIGTPDQSSGEFKHGYERDPDHPLHPEQYRIYFGAYDFISDFPNGVNYYVGKSDPAKDMNYVHWSVFGGYGNSRRTVQETGNGNINNWTISFDVAQSDLAGTSNATFTVQLAGAKTAAGNTDNYNATQLWNNIPYVVNVNGKDLPPWIIPYVSLSIAWDTADPDRYNQSSSCAVRSAVICYQLANRFNFPSSYLKANATNKIVLSLPFNATDYESALLARSIYVQYDALRLEVQ